MITILDKMINLDKFKDMSETEDSLVSFEYFTMLINLFADLCLRKNYIAIVFF